MFAAERTKEGALRAAGADLEAIRAVAQRTVRARGYSYPIAVSYTHLDVYKRQVPGNAFGDSGEGHVRISYSYSIGHLSEALHRIELFLQELGV